MDESFSMRRAREIAAQTLYGIHFADPDHLDDLPQILAHSLPVIAESENSLPEASNGDPDKAFRFFLDETSQLLETYRGFLKTSKQIVEKYRAELGEAGCNMQQFWKFFKASRSALNKADALFAECRELVDKMKAYPLENRKLGSVFLKNLGELKIELKKLLKESSHVFPVAGANKSGPGLEILEKTGELQKNNAILNDYATLLAGELALGAASRRSQILELLKTHAPHVNLERMGVMNLSLLALGLYEIIWRQADPAYIKTEISRLADEFGASRVIGAFREVLAAIEGKAIPL